MKKLKRSQATNPAIAPAAASASQIPSWWAWAAALAAFIAVFEVYGPALNGAFVLDDRYLPFMSPDLAARPLSSWLGAIRPLLMLSYWFDYNLSGTDPGSYHLTNVFFHLLTSAMVALIAAKLLDWTGVGKRQRFALSVFAGGCFLLHPVQTEAVAYVAGRSENLSVLFYFASFAVFLYRGEGAMTWARAIAVTLLFGAAFTTKEHTLTLPILLLLTDFFWNRDFRKNGILYGLLAAGAVLGGLLVWRVISTADTAGFHMKDLSPADYFFTQCRMLWIYLRMFFLPYGQNIDPEVAVSHGLFDHGAIVGFAALIALVAVAWTFRKAWPLASFGVLVFVLLLAPTSSVIPIRDLFAERRFYLPSIGLILIALDMLRRLRLREMIWAGAAVLAVCSLLTYQRSRVWADPIALWTDTVAKSPDKLRPRFQLAFALADAQRYSEAVTSYEIAARLAPPGDDLLIDWALALDQANRPNEALEKLRQAATLHPTAHVFSQIGMVNAKHQNYPEALTALATAEKLDPNFEITYVYRGKIYALSGDRAAAQRELRHALAINPQNQEALEALAQVKR